MTSGIDFNTYRPPGLYTEAVPGPQIGVRLATPTAVGLFGASVGYRTAVESVYIEPDLPDGEGGYAQVNSRPLRNAGVRVETVVVRNANSGEEYAANTDYTIELVSTGGSSSTPRDDVYAIKRTAEGMIYEGDTIEVSYHYTDLNYHAAHSFYDYDDLREAYGTPFDAQGNIVSELSLAAAFAFMNGAQRIICAAVDPGDKETPVLADYLSALDVLKDQTDISVVVPATGVQAIHEAVVAHVEQQSRNRFERRAVVGRDGSATTVTSAQLITDAGAIKHSRVALVSPAAMVYFAPELNREIPVGGQFLAAAVAGLSVSQIASEPLTRKQVRGFRDVYQRVPEAQRNLESQNGLMVVDRTRRGSLQIRHGVTTNSDNLLTREWNIIGQQDVMVYRLRDYLDNDQLIGSIIDDLTLINVKSSADAALQSLISDRVIRDYQDLKVRQVETMPEVIEVRYAWRPSLPLNYLVVRYSISLDTGETDAVQSV